MPLFKQDILFNTQLNFCFTLRVDVHTRDSYAKSNFSFLCFLCVFFLIYRMVADVVRQTYDMQKGENFLTDFIKRTKMWST